MELDLKLGKALEKKAEKRKVGLLLWSEWMISRTAKAPLSVHCRVPTLHPLVTCDFEGNIVRAEIMDIEVVEQHSLESLTCNLQFKEHGFRSQILLHWLTRTDGVASDPD